MANPAMAQGGMAGLAPWIRHWTATTENGAVFETFDVE